MINNLGYCCINMELSNKGITTNKGMIQKTFFERGIPYVSEITILNIENLIKILEWNRDNGIKMFRMSSDIFPWCSEYEIKDLPNYEKISVLLKYAGDLAKNSDQRLSFHPSHYTILASCNENVVVKAIKELRQHAEIMDLMGLEQSTYYPINVHIGTSKPSKEEAADRFCKNFSRLSDNVKSRLVVENDDKLSGFTPTDLYNMVYSKIEIPITFDYLHYKCNPDHGINEYDALKMCINTWSTKALTHYSDSKKLFEDSNSKELAHSDWIHQKIPTYGMDFSIELEVKMKEKALLKYIHDVENSTDDRIFENKSLLEKNLTPKKINGRAKLTSKEL